MREVLKWNNEIYENFIHVYGASDEHEPSDRMPAGFYST